MKITREYVEMPEDLSIKNTGMLLWRLNELVVLQVKFQYERYIAGEISVLALYCT